ncbi:MAG: TIGR03960 family B12-binding radical SAM protein [Candidatus Omnitrophota bacterium]
MNLTNFEEIISKVKRPARYLGNEYNVSRKDHHNAKVKIALCYPDLYEVGMSHLGLRILYGLLNAQSDIACERVFSPDTDLEEILRKDKIPLFSLETHTPLSEFDIIGFSLQYELNYTNLLNILDLSGIPLLSKDRDSRHPLIIAGGCCCLNPEPLADFIDLFCIGEAEELILEVVEKYKEFTVQRLSSLVLRKDKLLLESAKIKGVYVPSLYEVEYNEDGRIKKFSPRQRSVPTKIIRRIVHDLDKAFFPTRWLVPFIQIVHDRITLEIMRGCPGGCRFCQAFCFYRPARPRSVNSVLRLAKDCYNSTGYEEMSLLSLSSSDHPKLKEIIKELMEFFQDKYVGISLPSLKPRSSLSDITALLAKVRKSGLTFAPEAGTERLRKVINKNVDLDELVKVSHQAFVCGYRHLKLYFMLGLPTENEKDLDGIIDLAVALSRLRKEIDGHLAVINVSISCFIPKSHTPFQWQEMDSLTSLENKKKYLISRLRSSRPHLVNLKFHDFQMGFLEAVLCRGDRRIAKVILNAFQEGAKFDSWREYFNFPLWMEAFNKQGIDPFFYALRRRSFDEILPWEHIDLGQDRHKLQRDLQKALTINEL